MVANLAAPRRCSPKPGGEYEEYHPYGTTSWQAPSQSEVSQKRYRYTGKEKDEETGMYYHGARYYLPWLGRWAGADPMGLGDGPNRYAYVRGNPIGGRDPTGMGLELVTALLVYTGILPAPAQPSPTPATPTRPLPPLQPFRASDLLAGGGTQERGPELRNAPSPYAANDFEHGSLGPGGTLVTIGKEARALKENDSSYVLHSREDRAVEEIGDIALSAAAVGFDSKERASERAIRELEPPPAGTAYGSFTTGTGRSVSPAELRVARKLAQEGRDVVAIPEGKVRTADFTVDGRPTELKTVTNITSKDPSGALARIIVGGAGQAPSIVADVTGQASITPDLARRAAARAFGADERLEDVRIVGTDFDISVARGDLR